MSSAATFPRLWRELRDLEDEISHLCNTLNPKYSTVLKRLRAHIRRLREARSDVPGTQCTASPEADDGLPAGTLLARVLPMVDAHLTRTADRMK